MYNFKEFDVLANMRSDCLNEFNELIDKHDATLKRLDDLMIKITEQKAKLDSLIVNNSQANEESKEKVNESAIDNNDISKIKTNIEYFVERIQLLIGLADDGLDKKVIINDDLAQRMTNVGFVIDRLEKKQSSLSDVLCYLETSLQSIVGNSNAHEQQKFVYSWDNCDGGVTISTSPIFVR